MTIELDSTLAQAEVLFLSFSQLVADIDRRRAENTQESENQLRQRQKSKSSEAARSQVSSTARNASLVTPTLSDDLRELLQNTR